MNVRTTTELGRVLRSAIESSRVGNIPDVSDATATPESHRVKADTIRRWCRGEHEPGALELGRVALAVGISLDSLVFDSDVRPVALSNASAWSFSEKQMAELIEGFRALDRLNRECGKDLDVVATYCAAPKGTLAAILGRDNDPPAMPIVSPDVPPSNNDTHRSENSVRKSPEKSKKNRKRKKG
jgi:hypothetical protein